MGQRLGGGGAASRRPENELGLVQQRQGWRSRGEGLGRQRRQRLGGTGRKEGRGWWEMGLEKEAHMEGISKKSHPPRFFFFSF